MWLYSKSQDLLLCSRVLYRIWQTHMIGEIFVFLLCVAGAFNVRAVFQLGDNGSIERKKLRILIGQLLGMGYLSPQVSKILGLYD